MTECIRSTRERRDVYIPVSRNLCNYPLARDGRVRGHWLRNRRTGDRRCALPGQDRINLRLLADAPAAVKRVPNGFDVAALVALLGAAAVRKSTILECRTITDLMAEMRVPATQRHRRQAEAALELWQHVSLDHDCWYTPRGERGRVMPPPILRVERGPGRMVIRLSTAWLKTSQSFYAKVPPGLPVRATHQNLILWLLCAKPAGSDEEDGTKFTQPMSRRRLCGIIGANHHGRNRVLASAIRAAEEWFAARGGKLIPLPAIRGGEGMTFSVKHPVVRRRKSESREGAHVRRGQPDAVQVREYEEVEA